MKKVLSLLLALVFVVSAFPVTFVSAADVIVISDAAQLAAIGSNDNYPLNGSYKLTKNISLSSYDNWTPIGSSSAFSGTFEGNGKTISGLKVNASGTYAGLFGQVSGTVKNLTVIGSVTLNASVSNASSVYAGILAGNVSGWFATIDSCSTSGEVKATLNCTATWGIGSANVYAGGVIGNSSSMIASEILSHKSGAVTATYTGSKVSGNAYAGGVAGKTSAGLTDCYNKADVTASSGNGSSYAGGLAGQCAATETSYNTGTITAGTYCGAIAGYTTGSSKYCYFENGSASQGFGGSSGSSTPTATGKKLSDMYNEKLTGFNFEDVWEGKALTLPAHYSVNEVITGTVSILGNFQVGEKLTADMSKVTPASAYNGTLIKYVKYQWERGTKDGDGNMNYEKISGATSDSYTLTSSDMGKYVRLVVRGRYTYGGKLESKEGLVSVAVPKNVKVSTDDNGIKVSWDKISGAEKYTVYRSTYSEGFMGFGAGYNSYTEVGTATTNSYLDTTVTTNTKYKYKVSVTMGGTESDKSAESAEITAQLACQHSWDSGKETTKATCEEAGVKTYTCSICKGKRTETIPAKGHNFTTISETKPTCEKEGTKSLYCSGCFTTKKETTPALGHSYDAGVITKEPTCEAEGVKTFTCTTCKNKKTEAIKATGHSFASSETVKEATCTEDGLKRGTCKSCGQYKEVTVSALGHDWQKNFTIDKPATYEETGEKSKHCNRCDARTEVTVIAKLVKLEIPVQHFTREKDGVSVTWEKVTNATGYNVYKAEQINGTWTTWKKVKTLASYATSYKDTSVELGHIYRYAVSATANGEETDYGTQSMVIFIGEPTVTGKTSTKNGVQITWNKLNNIEGYMVFKKTANGMETVAVLNVNTTSFTDVNVKDGETYTYAVASMDFYGNAGTYEEFTVTYKVPVVGKLATPTVKSSVSAKGMQITWNEIEGAESYIVYQRTYNAKTKKWSGWKILKNGYTGTSYVDTTVKLGTYYKYTVRAVNEDTRSAFTATKGLKYNVTPVVKTSNAAKGVKVTWTTAANATGYAVYSSTYNAKTKKWTGWKYRGTAKPATKAWVDKTAKSGTYYRYTVRAVNGTFKSTYKASANIMYLAQPTVTAESSENGITVKWNKVPGVKNYTVYRSVYENGKWSSWTNVGTGVATSVGCVDRGVQSGVTYRYTVRAVNGNYRSSYVASNSVTK